jgi:hypothetical protein
MNGNAIEPLSYQPTAAQNEVVGHETLSICAYVEPLGVAVVVLDQLDPFQLSACGTTGAPEESVPTAMHSVETQDVPYSSEVDDAGVTAVNDDPSQVADNPLVLPPDWAPTSMHADADPTHDTPERALVLVGTVPPGMDQAACAAGAATAHAHASAAVAPSSERTCRVRGCVESRITLLQSPALLVFHNAQWLCAASPVAPEKSSP